jgi:hypothetical protein
VAGVGLGLRPRRRLPPEPGSERTAPTMPIRPQPEPPPTEPEAEPDTQRTQSTRRLWADETDD